MQFKQHTAEAVNITSLVQGFATNLLGRHVTACPLNFRLATQQPTDALLLLLRNCKVDQLDFALLIDQKVIRLDVAVDPSVFMHILQSFSTLLNDRRYLFLPICVLDLPNPLLEVLGFKVFKCDIGDAAARNVEFVDFDDTRMMEFTPDCELMFEQRDLLFVSTVFFLQRLECTALVVDTSNGFPDLTCRAGTHQFQ